MSVTQELRSKRSLRNFVSYLFDFLYFSLQVFQSRITALQDEMEEKGQEMDKLQQELKDKEVENRIAGKKGDQLVSVCFFVSYCFLFNLTITVCFAFPVHFLVLLLFLGFILFCIFDFGFVFLFVYLFLCFVLFFFLFLVG